MKTRLLKRLVVMALFMKVAPTNAYEINNHADMSQEAAVRSVLQLYRGQPEGDTKLFRLGLKAFNIGSENQKFPLADGLGAISLCFGIKTDVHPVTGVQTIVDDLTDQPAWNTRNGGGWLTIAEMMRYGACYEDSIEPNYRVFAHFYNPQDFGAPLSVGPFLVGPSSLQWSLSKTPQESPIAMAAVGTTSHYSWEDARDYFYSALTSQLEGVSAGVKHVHRLEFWGKTFQALGHIVHHLQDMAQPAHVRNDNHCDADKCRQLFGGRYYRPSGYETHFRSRYDWVRSLVQFSASFPMMFGLPREYWNAKTTSALTTPFNLSAPAQYDQGMAAYTSTNFTSAGADFRATLLRSGLALFDPAAGLPFPEPSGEWIPVRGDSIASEVGMPLTHSRILCNGDAANCIMRFMGTTTDRLARTSSTSSFSQKLLRPANAYSGDGVFQQNYFTYDDAAIKLIPQAVDYSTGLINYFFRGDMTIWPPEEGVYGLLDGADSASNCKDTCGFRKIRARVTNTTAPINDVAQDMTAGTVVAVARFSRNHCYQPDWSGDLGELNPPTEAIKSACFSEQGVDPDDEIVVSAPINVAQMAVGVAQEFTFDFSANPVPINAWNLRLQIVFRGTLGREAGAVATSTVRMSAPTVMRFFDEHDWILINQHLYRIDEVESDQALMSQISPRECVATDGNGQQSFRWALIPLVSPSGVPVDTVQVVCYPYLTQTQTTWTSTSGAGTPLATTSWSFRGGHSMLAVLMDPNRPVSQKLSRQSNFQGESTEWRTLLPRRVEWDDAAKKVVGHQFWGYRGLHSTDWSREYWQGSADATLPTAEEEKTRPKPTSLAPVRLFSIDPRYR